MDFTNSEDEEENSILNYTYSLLDIKCEVIDSSNCQYILGAISFDEQITFPKVCGYRLDLLSYFTCESTKWNNYF
ncbi:unnamed protein product [Rotaria sp. Silwood2]|nr:unnamed protein product [Rotaria sp. Silwood2]CAF2609821.1 unnamed protein product [Rotaria sp. Silwood2]CAF3022652.1 unnamed protein product [Rotaria sp. Silwood2]CAF3023548.1 unnamed protein product [Rotaria sp. Silwood2]CAF4292707.1 unnamed protein product [Rotaria sp. Silwood2]